jgi:poly(hydroxyalkanoate) depolymerase family esterase
MTHDKQSADDGSGFNRRTVLKTVGVSAAVATGVSSMNTANAAAGTYTSGDYNGRYYGKYLPSTYDGSEAVPLVMMLHGCSQNADGFKDETQMNQVAEDNKFIAVYPEETEGINSCWNWFEDSNTLRGQGQVQELAEGIVGQVESNENIDSDRIYVAGFSAGAYMVPNLIVEYADVFAAGGIHSGGMYDVAESQSEGNQVIGDQDCSDGSSSDPQVEGEHAYDRMEQNGLGDYQVPTMVFHGTDDGTVTPCNGDEAVEQATETNDLLDDDSDNGSVDYTADTTNTGSGPDLSYTEYVYEDADGNPIVDYYVVDGMGHAWSGGSDTGSYTAPGGPDASAIMWDYFSQFDNSLNDEPTADIVTSDDIADVGQTVDFDGSGSSDPDGTIDSYEWDFGDGSTATGETASHAYDSTGNYDVTLTVTDDQGATGTATVTVQVCDGNCPPKADIVASSTSVTTEDTVDFDAGGSSDADGSIDSYEWDFQSDGTVDATGETASHTYSSTGTYTATVTVTDDDGATDSASVEITVESALYCGEAENETHVNNGRAYNSGGCYYAEGSDEYMGSCISTDLSTLEETSTGYFEVVDSCPDGGSDGGNSAPTADVSASSTTVATGETVDFDGSGSSDSDGSISSYEWDWTSDGTYDATGETASHSYSSTGEYTVTLRVTDDDGATDTATVTITVESDTAYCGTATNQTHVDNGRAYYSGGCYYAEGSSEYLGCISSTETTLKETSDGYFEEVSSC